jgi:hypothetical protein
MLYQKEKELKSVILHKHGLSGNDKYNIVNDPVNVSGKIIPRIDNNYKTINLNFSKSKKVQLLDPTSKILLLGLIFLFLIILLIINK